MGRTEIAAPAAQVDSGEDEFVAAGRDEITDVRSSIAFGERLREWPRV